MYKVKSTKEAKSSLAAIKAYLLEQFSNKEYEKLSEKIKKVTSLIQKGNITFKYSKETNCYKVVLHKNSSMYYRIKEDTIIILMIWDNRMMKGKNKFE